MNSSNLIQVVVTLIIVGVLLWAVNAITPIDEKIKQVINVVVIVGAVLWVLAILFPHYFHFNS